MTTQVTVVNHEDSKHDVELQFAGQTHVLAPGDSFTTHIWAQNGMSVKELPIAKPAQPDASGAKVYTPEGVEIPFTPPFQPSYGAMAPDPAYIGMTPDQLMAYRALKKND